MNESFENDFWLPYDKRVGKDKCITKYALLSPSDHLKIKVHVPGFVSKHRNKQYRPNPLSYLNGKMWLDENIYSNDSETLLYKTPVSKPLSKEPAKYFNPEDGRKHMRDKLKKNFENGGFIRDWGNIYTTLLRDKCGMVIAESDIEEISAKVHHEVDRKRNRFEEPFTGSVWAEIRDQCLNHFLKECKESGRKIYEEI